jgi:DNA-binding ferritin-like protein
MMRRPSPLEQRRAIQRHTGLSQAQRKGVVTMLHHVLADAHVLDPKTHHDHWHVAGPQCNELHKFAVRAWHAKQEFVMFCSNRKAGRE